MSVIEYILTGLGSVVGLLIVIVGWFTTRTMQQLDTTVSNLTTEVSALKEDRKAQEQLNDLLSSQLNEVKEENKSFRRILNALDKIIYKALGIDINSL
ncbi:hypothetical protein Q5H93_02985 [Hymenobacter sp. ASUV-10]|uniref:Uncharacterized protein n=1 Tax=Hymenobacter aranciens TaxID=3063996 RepID=A0ABT9B7K4_9BACT|nr:hypothetical protein [Hymenobacter sp. ASUV-10]MDO7873684.1 hypothetical protein [Hymenobacter sp. ASUV-10]